VGHATGQHLWRRVRPVLLVLLLPVLLLILQNVLLNVALRPLINRRPERVKIDYTAAWMLVPGHVTVRGLRIRGQGRADQWLITAQQASGSIVLSELRHQTFHAGAVRASGLTLWYRRRADVVDDGDVDVDGAASPEAVAVAVAVAEVGELLEVAPEASKTAPIPGLSNPPVPSPEQLYPVRHTRWVIRLDDIQAEDLNELWVGNYRIIGHARATADLSIVEPLVDLAGALSFLDVQAAIGETPVARNVSGDLRFLIDGMDRRAQGPERIHALSAQARLAADVQDLRFLDFYLAAVPWLSVSGIGHVNLGAGLEQGGLLPGSTLAATFPALVVRVLSNEVSGTGRVQGEIRTEPDGTAGSHLDLDFQDFAITPDGSTQPLVAGQGFHVGLSSPDVALDLPFSTVSAQVELPESRIPDVMAYNGFLPEGIGLSLRGGTGSARGHLQTTSADNHAQGELIVHGEALQVQLDQLSITANLSLHAQLADASFDEGHYDLSGTILNLDHVGLVDQAHADPADGQRPWSASITVPSGAIDVGAPVYLDTRIAMHCSDSAPFIAAFAQKKDLPRWAQSVLSVKDVSGEARLQVGDTTLALGPCQVRGGKHYQVDLDYHRQGRASNGVLLARAGVLSLGIALRPDGAELQLFNAKHWFEKQLQESP